MSTTEEARPLYAPTAMISEWVAAAAILLALVALALVRCELTDTPYHLATARYAAQTGKWPTTNTFSWTHPDYPLYQQYPVYQTLLAAVHGRFGWEGLSVFHLASWTLIFALWLRWGGPGRWSIALPFAAILLLLGLRERMVLRPDILTMIYFVGILYLADFYRAGRWWAPLLFPLVILLWVNSHQMFWIGLVLQGALIVHRGLVQFLGGRFDLDDKGRNVPWWPLGMGLVLSIAACFCSPIGSRILEVPTQTFGSLYFHKQNVAEFAPFYSSPQATWLVIVSLMLGLVGIFLSRPRIVPFEVFVWLIGAMMVAGAIRGTAFFVAISVALFIRGIRRATQRTDLETTSIPEISSPIPFPAKSGTPLALPRWGAVIITLLLCSQIYFHRWIQPSRVMEGSQFGMGKNLGAWPEQAIEFIRRFPPPGPMMNLSWYIGNPLIFDLAGKHPVFVDPRFEAFPRPFLVEAIAAETDDHAFDRLVDDYQPTWLVGELRIEGVRQQMARLLSSDEWEFVHIDPVVAIMVRRSDETLEYLDDHRMEPAQMASPKLLDHEPDLLALQQLRLAAFMADLGRLDAARHWLGTVGDNAQKYSAVATQWSALKQTHPELFAPDL